MTAIIIGNGSAAKRHKASLKHLKCNNYAIIASLTPKHHDDIEALLKGGFNGVLMVEKPMMIRTPPPIKTFVGYQLRFHPKIQALKKQIQELDITSVSVHAGQSIDLWGGSYHKSKENGGGVLNDYSHEIDLIQYLFGKMTLKNSLIGYVGGIESEATATIRLETERCKFVSVHLNYIYNPPNRTMRLNTSAGEFVIDYRVSPDNLTALMHADILDNGGISCTYEEAVAVDDIIRQIRENG